MRVAIVGSRKRTDAATVQAVRDVVALLPAGSVVISGGAAGVDSIAASEAEARGIDVVVHRPDYVGATTRFQATQACYDRNRRIVMDADLVVAFVASDRKGGTENAIKQAKRAGRRVILVGPGEPAPTSLDA